MATSASGDPAEASTNKNSIYINNLDERVKLSLLVETLTTIFSTFGAIVDIVCKKNVKAHGQAFIVFEDPKAAAQAVADADGFPIFDKPMKCSMARAKSDAIAKRLGNDEQFELHKRRRVAEKERRLAADAQSGRKREASGAAAQQPAKKIAKTAGGFVPDEYLPPNKTLMVQNIPTDYITRDLEALFGRFSGFKDVRTVPGREGLAFVEYADEEGAISAKEKTANMTVGRDGSQLKVTFQRQRS